jgi:hypothetical protein|tara:strand:+ start:111 stop:833 length:723 start_codon:yes stop_codon:yes gene_type:complete
MSKYLYRVEGGRYGGELAIGKVTAEFVRYWQEKEQDELMSHIVGLDWEDSEDIDTDSPAPYEDMSTWNNWYECDDYEHHNAYYADGQFSVHDVSGAELESDDVQNWDDDAVDVSPYYLMSRECYAESQEPEDLTGYIPVLCFHSGEKGSFGQWFIETDQPFDPKKLAYTQVETDLCELVTGIYYDKKELETNYDYAESNGKGYYAYVGWLKEEWWDSPVKEQDIDWTDYDDELVAEAVEN